MAKSETNAAKSNGTKTNGFTNPYRVGGGYWATVEALRTLGVGKMHDHAAIIPAVRKAMGDGWKAFAAKEGKLSPEERVLVNVMVTARDDYGKPLRDAGYEVAWDGRAKVAGLFKLGTAPAAAPKADAPKVASKPQTPQDATGAKGKAKTAPAAPAKPSKGGKGKAK